MITLKRRLMKAVYTPPSTRDKLNHCLRLEFYPVNRPLGEGGSLKRVDDFVLRTNISTRQILKRPSTIKNPGRRSPNDSAAKARVPFVGQDGILRPSGTRPSRSSMEPTDAQADATKRRVANPLQDAILPYKEPAIPVSYRSPPSIGLRVYTTRATPGTRRRALIRIQLPATAPQVTTVNLIPDGSDVPNIANCSQLTNA